MDLQSSEALLRILNLVAMADGECSPEEENLLESLRKQHKLQSQTIAWQDDIEDSSDVAALAGKIAPEHHLLTYRTAMMVASISKRSEDHFFVNAQEDELLRRLAGALALKPEAMAKAKEEAEEQICRQPSLWQVLHACFGSQFASPFERQYFT